MPLTTNGCVEKSIRAVSASPPIVIAAGNNADILPDITNNFGQFASRYIQNVGANSTNYAIGQDCTAVSYHGVIAAGQQFNATDCGSERINCYSPNGTTLVSTSLRRIDVDAGGGGILPQKLP